MFDERMAREIKLLLEPFAPGRPICGAVVATSMLRHLGWEVDSRIDRQRLASAYLPYFRREQEESHIIKGRQDLV